MYVLPVGAARISDSFAAHVKRHSVNPGTDYAVPIGTKVKAPYGGRVVVADTGSSGAGGRTIAIDLDDGRGIDLLHLSSLSVRVGQHVDAGQVIARSGATAHGSNRGVGPHLHITLRNRHGSHYLNAGNIDFAAAARATTAAHRIAVDGRWGALTTKALQRELGVRADGIRGWGTVRALQLRLKIAGTGAFTLATRKALQRHLGVRADGVVGPVSVKALQRRLNAGTF